MTVDERYAPGRKAITIVVEDDGNWFECQSLDAHWLPDLIAVLQRAAPDVTAKDGRKIDSLVARLRAIAFELAVADPPVISRAFLLLGRDAADRIEALESRLALLTQAARRYEWLREQASDLSFMFDMRHGKPTGILARELLDAAIDDAIRASPEG